MIRAPKIPGFTTMDEGAADWLLDALDAVWDLPPEEQGPRMREVAQELRQTSSGLQRIPWSENEIRPCGDCGVEPGQLHVPDCDMELCPACGGQLITCWTRLAEEEEHCRKDHTP